MIRRVILVLAILVVTVVPVEAGDEYSGGRGIVGGPVSARSLDHYPLIPSGRVAVYASPIWTGPYAYQSRLLQ